MCVNNISEVFIKFYLQDKDSDGFGLGCSMSLSDSKKLIFGVYFYSTWNLRRNLTRSLRLLSFHSIRESRKLVFHVGPNFL